MSKRVLEKSNSFLVVRLGAIGDALRVLPAVRRLRVRRPQTRIGWAVEDWVYPVLAGNTNVDTFHVLRRAELNSGIKRAWAEACRFLREIREARYEVVLDFHGRLKSGIVSRLSGAPYRVGYGRGQSTEFNYLFTNINVFLEQPLENRVLRFLHLLQPLGIDTGFDSVDVGLTSRPDLEDRARRWYRESGMPDLAVYPGTSRRQAAYHRWPSEKWAELIRRTKTAGVRSVVFWGPDDREFAESIVESVGEPELLAPRTTLPEMMEMLRCFPAFIGSNTAAMHMAWLQGVATAVFVGPACPETDGPLPSVPSHILQAAEYFRPGASKRKQPAVTTEVSVEEASDAVLSLLARRRDRTVEA